MKRPTTILFGLMLMATALLAQNETPLDNAAATDFLRNMAQTALNTQHLECQFEQQRHVSVLTEPTQSRGRMSYTAPAQLSWQYTSPQPMNISLNDGLCRINNAQGEVNIPPAAQRHIRSLTQLIGSLVNGTALTDSKAFSTELNKLSNNRVQVRLTPKNSKIRKMFEQIDMEIDPHTMRCQTITLRETSGDRTNIEFSNIITTSK